MNTTNRRKLNRLIRECYEEGYGEIEPVSMALLTIEEIIVKHQTHESPENLLELHHVLGLIRE